MKRLVALLFLLFLLACVHTQEDFVATKADEAELSIHALDYDIPPLNHQYTIAEDKLLNSSTQIEDSISYYNWRNAVSFMDHNNVKMLFSREWSTVGDSNLIEGFDSSDLPFVAYDQLPSKENYIEWSGTWIPRSYSFEKCAQLLIPQIWEEPIALQDLCALYLSDMNTGEEIIAHMTIQSFLGFIKRAEYPSSDIYIQNVELLTKLLNIQEGRVCRINGVTEVDLDNDGVEEKIELRIDDGVDNILKQYSLYINDSQVEVFYNSDLTIELFDLHSYKVICVKPNGNSDRTDLYRSKQNALFLYKDGEARFIGAIHGSITLFIGDSRFLTTEKTDCQDPMFATYYVESMTHEYGITSDGLLYHVSHGKVDSLDTPFGWQQQNSVWTLQRDLPLYEMDGITVSGSVLQKGTKVIIRGISENGYLFLCNEKGTGGIVKLIRPEDEPQDPYTAPGGRRLSFYFCGYDGFAYAD